MQKAFSFFVIFIITLCINVGTCAIKNTLSTNFANAGRDSVICKNSIKLYSNLPDVNEYGYWQILTGTGIINTITSDFSNIGVDKNVLSWTIVNTVTSAVSKDTIVITNNTPTIASAGISKVICTNTLLLDGNNPTLGIGNWDVLMGNGNLGNANNYNTSFSNITSGLNILRWTITKNLCKSTSTVSINFNRAQAGANQEICTDFASLNANIATVNNGQWTLIQPSPTGALSDPIILDDLDPNTTISQLQAGANILKWTTRNFSPNSCASSAFVTIVSNIVTKPNAGNNQTICNNNTQLLATAPPTGTGRWYILTGAGVTFSNNLSNITTITNIPKGLNLFEWQVVKGLCVARDTVEITNNSPSQANIASNKKNFVICSDTSTLVADMPLQGFGSWIKITGNSILSNPNNVATSVTGILPGINIYKWVVSIAGCPPSEDLATITRQNFETAKVPFNYLQVCNSNIVTIAGLNTASGIGSWKILYGNGIIANPNTFQTTIAFNIDGRTKLEWKVNILGCVATTDTLTIDHFSVSNASVTGLRDLKICSDSVNVSAILPNIGIGKWQLIGGNGNFLNENTNSTRLRNLSVNTNFIRWTVTNNFCSSFVNVTITNNKPTNALANADKSICSTNDSLLANIPVQGNGIWTVLSSTGIIGVGANHRKLISNLNSGKNIFLWTISKDICASVDTLILTNNLPSTGIILTQKDTIICNNIITLNAIKPAQGLGNWTKVINNSTVLGTTISGSNVSTTFSNIPQGTNVFLWNVSVSSCPTSIQSLTITNNQVTTPKGITPTNCMVLPPNTPAMIFLTANNPTNFGETASWRTLQSPGATNFSTNTANVTVNGVGGTGFYKFGWKIIDNSGQCFKEDTINIAILPQATVASNQCLKNGPINIPFLTAALVSTSSIKTSQGENGIWSYIPTPVDLFFSSLKVNSITGVVLGLERGVHTFKYSIRNNNLNTCESSINTKITVLTKADVGVKNICLSNINYTNVVANSTNNIVQSVGGKGTWVTLTTGTSINQSGVSAISAYISQLQDGVNKFRFFTSNDNDVACTDSDTLTVTKLTTPIAGIATFTITTTTTTQIILNANSQNASLGETGNWIAETGANYTIDELQNKNTTVRNLSPGRNQIFWRITNTISGCTLQDITNINVQTKANIGQNIVMVTNTILSNATIISPVLLNTNRGEIGTWSIVSAPNGSNPISVIGNNFSTLNLSNLRRGVYNIRYTVSNNSIIGFNNSANIFLTIITKAVSSAICTSNQNISVGTNPILPINPAVGEVFAWRTSSVVGIVQNINDSIPTASLSNIPEGITKIYFTISNKFTNTSNTDSSFITRLTKPLAGNDTFMIASPITNKSNSVMNANMPKTLLGEVGLWTSIPSNLPIPVPSTAAKGTIIGINPGVNTYLWNITNTINGCTLRDTANIFVQTKALAGTNIVLKNSNTSISLIRTITSSNFLAINRGEYGVWNIIEHNSKTNPLTFLGNSMNDLVLQNLNRGVYKLRWTVFNINFTGSNSSELLLTVMTKAKAGSPRCIIDSTILVLGKNSNNATNPSVNERFGWRSVPPLPLTYNFNDSIPIVRVNNLPMGKTIFYFTVTNTGSNATDTDSTIVIKVSNPDIGIDRNLCSDTFQLNPLYDIETAVGENFKWRILNGNSQLLDQTFTPKVARLDTGNNFFSYTISNDFCIKSDTINLRNNQPYFATITGLNTSCFTSNILKGNDPTLQFKTATSMWIIKSQPKEFGKDTAKFQTPEQYISGVNNMILAGVYKFQFKIKNINCELLSNEFSIRRDNLLSITPPTPFISVCKSSIKMQAKPLLNNVIGTWQCISGSCDFDDINKPDAVLSNIGQSGSGVVNSYFWKVQSGECQNFYPVTILGFSKPSRAKILQSKTTFCMQDTINLTSLHTFPGINGNPQWSIIQGESSIKTPNNITTSIIGLKFGDNKFEFKIYTGDSCPVSRDTIMITKYKRSTNLNLGSDKEVCNDTIRLLAPTPEVPEALGRWSIVSSLTAAIFNPRNPSTYAYNVASGNYRVKWKVVNGECADSSYINYKVGTKIIKNAIITADTSICDTSTILIKANRKGKWKPINNLAVFANDTASKTNLRLTNFGNNKFVHIITNDFCISYDTLTVYTAKPPTKANAGNNSTTCINQITITGNVPLNGTQTWTTIDATSTTLTNSNVYTTNKLVIGKNQFLYKISNFGCTPSSDTIDVYYNNISNAYAGKDTIICDENYNLDANVITNGLGIWTTTSDKIKFENIQNPKTEVTAIPNGDNLFVWTVSYKDCPESVSIVKVTNNKPSTVMPFNIINAYTNAVSIDAQLPSFGLGKWVYISGNGTIENPLSGKTNVSELAVGENVIRWVVSSAGCNSTYADQKIIMNDIKIPGGFSPNNDNYNDYFEIIGLETYPNSKLEVFNRWGKQVYLANNYTNKWEGTNNKNDNLGNDTYFYVLTLSNGKVYKDYVIINR